MELWVPKVISLLLILVITLVFGLLPIRVVCWLRRREQDDWVYRRRNNVGGSSRARMILSYINCFSGGVFLSTCLLHLFPEVIEKYNSVMVNITSTDFPIAELLISVGFFLIMLIEHGVMSLGAAGLHGHGHSHGGERHADNHPHDHRQNHGNNHGHNVVDNEESQSILPSAGPSYGAVPPTQVKPVVEAESVCGDPLMDSYAHYHHCEDEAPHHHHPGQTHAQTVQIHTIRSLVLLLALSLHTLFEGLALGLETTVGKVWTLFAALAIHKAIIAFTMGVQFADTFQQAKVLLYMVTFSVVAPIGIAIGTTITSYNNGSFGLDMSSMVLQGLATGTFLYVTFFEVLQKELGVGEHSITKVLAIIAGFIAISLTNLMEGL